MKVIYVIEIVVNRPLAKGLQSAAVYLAVEEGVQKYVSEPPGMDAVATKLVKALSFTIPVNKVVKYEIKKNSLDNANMKEKFLKLAETAE